VRLYFARNPPITLQTAQPLKESFGFFAFAGHDNWIDHFQNLERALSFCIGILAAGCRCCGKLFKDDFFAALRP
jgi:hypothetical protein